MKVLALAFLAITSSALAAPIAIRCSMNDWQYKNQFSLTTVIDSEATEFEALPLSFTLRKLGPQAAETGFSTVRSGTIERFTFDTVEPRESLVIKSIDLDPEAELVKVNLITDAPYQFSSHIRMSDGTTYYIKCDSL